MPKIELGRELVLPGGALDMHVHLREPGATEKEDFEYGTRAAIAGGVTAVIDMVNNPGHFTNTPERLHHKMELAEGRISSDLGLHYRYQPEEDNVGTFGRAVKQAFGLKSMLEISTGSNKRTEAHEFREGWTEWHRVAQQTQPIILHTEVETIKDALAIAAGEIGHPTHVAHVSNRAELEAVIAAKKEGLPVTCGVTPHHLFMDRFDERNWFQRMKPPLANPEDVDFLWANLDYIDVFETDHAPHTAAEKMRANKENPDGKEDSPVKSYGVPGLEAMLPLLFDAYGRYRRTPFRDITADQLANKLAVRPRQILGVPVDNDSSTTIRYVEPYSFGEDSPIQSKCGWTPYLGMVLNAKVVEVKLRGTVVYSEGKFLTQPQGEIIRPRAA